MAGLPRRIIKETQRLQKEPVAGISCAPYEDNLRYFRVVLQGPQDTPYQGGLFSLEMFFKLCDFEDKIRSLLLENSIVPSST